MAWFILATTGVWVIFWFYWIWAARHTGQTQRREASRSRAHVLHLAILLLAYILNLPGLSGLGPLNARFLPESLVLGGIGLLILLASLALAVWARRHLGRYWGSGIVIRAGHELIRSGPYALVRHPIYTGFVGGILGTAIVIGEWRGLLAVILLLVSYWQRIRQEETWLVAQFGPVYEQYRREVKALVPLLW
ncbi:MAG: isoprenylcysteine carboxylmethyltransferase family protein [Anaerolineae bacterium]|nr:isoprenylcysteine carboxylmethyltransferase family protein [Anaerolineae bacterium]